MQNSTGPPEGLTLGRIRHAVKASFAETAGWAITSVTLETEVECDFRNLFDRISLELGHKVTLPVGAPPNGRDFTVGELAEYIADHQAQFEPMPEN